MVSILTVTKIGFSKSYQNFPGGFLSELIILIEIRVLFYLSKLMDVLEKKIGPFQV